MLNQLGSFSLIFGLIFSFAIIGQSSLLIKKKEKFSKELLAIILLQFVMILISFFSLVFLFLKSEFSNNTVYNHSHSLTPLFYKFSATWGNHEGSLLLWLLVLSFFILVFSLSKKKLDNITKLYTIFFQQVIIIGFFFFTIFASNPFLNLYPIPNEGLGLNPILQDPLLAIHPPILYLGYVGSSIIFSFSLAGMITKNIDSNWAKIQKKWVLFSWVFLTFGILLGSIWAYYELGWGGFWFWDPVENVSLMPWFCLTALLHSIVVLEKRDTLKNWTIILSISTFSLSMSGTFLVRSGILNSVHTFANDPERGLFILVFLFLLIIMSFLIFFINFTDLKIHKSKFSIISKDTAILVNNWFMMFFLSVVLIGTIYPIFLEVITNEKISVGPPFYQKLIIPFLVPFLFFMSFGPSLKWIKDEIVKIDIKIIIILFVNLIISLLVIKHTDKNYLFASLLLAFSLYLFYSTSKDLLNKQLSLAQKVAHFSFSLLILSILMNGIMSKEYNLNMKVGDQAQITDRLIVFKDLEVLKKDNFQIFKGYFEVKNNSGKVFDFFPEIRVYDQPNISTSEADINISIFNDNVMTFNYLNDGDYFNVRFQYKPLMLWIWVSTFLLGLSGFLKISSRTWLQKK